MPDVIGAIRDKWLAIGGDAFTGPALDIERPTFDGIGRQRPRYSSGESGFMSNMSVCGGPPPSQHTIMCLALP